LGGPCVYPRADRLGLPSQRRRVPSDNGPLRRSLRSQRPDLLLAPNYTLPLLCRAPAVLFEHDISFVSHPEWYSRRDVLKTRWLVPRSLSRAAAVVTESEFSKHEILKYFPFVPEDKIRVIYPGINDRFFRVTSEKKAAWKQAKGLEGKTVVGFLGSIFNRRHIPELIEAVQLLRVADQSLMLYLVGRDRSRPPQDIQRLVRGADWILWEQEMGDADLPTFYSTCDVFVYCSDYEGFGLPPLEALACGTVPLVLNRTSLAEVYTGMAALVEGADPESIRRGLERLLSGDDLRRGMLENFAGRRPRFSWRKAAEDLGRLIREIVGGSRL
jgi:glycosyltransferase involved in cell wall biosynthesis